jgi:hypothetical protein
LFLGYALCFGIKQKEGSARRFEDFPQRQTGGAQPHKKIGQSPEGQSLFRTSGVFLWWAGVRSRKKCEWADESSQSIASCGNGWSKYLSFQMKR